MERLISTLLLRAAFLEEAKLYSYVRIDSALSGQHYFRDYGSRSPRDSFAGLSSKAIGDPNDYLASNLLASVQS